LDRSNDASGTHTEIVASTSLNGGWVNITRPDVNSTVKLQMNAITRSAGATLNFGAVNIADTDTTNTNGILGPWVTVGGADFAYNSTNAADGTINAYNGYTDVQRLTPGTIADGSATNVRLVEGGGSAGNIALGAATTNINTLNQSASGGSGAATIDMDGKTLAVNGLLAGAGSGALTIGSSANSGTLRTATASGELIVHNYSSNPLTINSVISNNTGASRLTVTGTGTTILAGLNTHTGETRISGGVLEAAIGTGLSSSTHLRLDGGVLQSTGSFTWTNGSNNTAGQFNWSSENGGGFAAKGSKLTVKVGNNPNTEQKWAGVAEASNGTFATAGNAILGPLKFGSTTADSEVEFQNRIDLNGETREIQVTDNTGSSGDFATLSGVIRNSSALVPAGIYKSGTGTLVLSNANTYDGVTTVAAGTLLVNNASGSGTGTGAVNMKAGAALGGDGSVGGSATFNNESIFAWNLSVTDPADTGSATVADTFAVTGDLADGDAAGGSVFKILLAGTQTFADTFWNANQSWTNVLTSGNSFDLENLFTSFTYANASGSISGPSNGSFSLSGSSLSYNFAAIPEPTSALAGLLLTAGLLRRRRK
jgi:autotransporter-associated beta strand protein